MRRCLPPLQHTAQVLSYPPEQQGAGRINVEEMVHSFSNRTDEDRDE